MIKTGTINKDKLDRIKDFFKKESYQFIEKGKKKYIESISQKKMEELAEVKKTVKNAVLLNPHRYKRKPYIVRSQKLNYAKK